MLVVITGVSGSGKSSLAVDTIFAEGQRQYFETLSLRARQLLDHLPRADVDSIDGLQPTLCIDQHRAPRNRRSTVGTLTEIYDFLRILMSRVADLFCHRCGTRIQQHSESQIVDWIVGMPEGTRLMLLAPLVRGKQGAHADSLEEIRKSGLVRVRLNGQLFELDQHPNLDPNQSHAIEAVVDRIVVREGVQDRLTESLGLALKLGRGSVVICSQSQPTDGNQYEWNDQFFSTTFSCPKCDLAYQEMEPRTFSFNSPYGACRECDGLGTKEQFEWDLVIDMRKSIEQGAIIPWRGLPASLRKKRIALLGTYFALDKTRLTTPIHEFPEPELATLIHGVDEWIGLSTLLENEWATTTTPKQLDLLQTMRSEIVCNGCRGGRLAPQANAAKLGDRTITEIVNLTIDDALRFFDSIDLNERQRQIGEISFAEIRNRLRYLQRVGVGYLQLARTADSLSGGEHQRVRLATALGTGLAGVCYILDEPTVGLHPRDTRRMIDAIRDLKQGGSCVLVVEHDEDVMRSCDWLIECGPGAGELGGQIVCFGTVDEISRCKASATGSFLSGRRKIQVAEVQRTRPMTGDLGNISIRGASIHNIRHLDIDIPLGRLVAITGVSGSGKSSLFDFVIAPNLRQVVERGDASTPKYCHHFSVPNIVRRAIAVDQLPMGRNSRSNPATYSGVFTEIRKLYAATPLAKQLGYTATRFSMSSSEGRCNECKGLGETRMDLKFLPELVTPCTACQGRRYNQQTLQVRYRDLTIADVLDLSIDSARDIFQNFEKIDRVIKQFQAVGLGYLRLGQAGNTLSGGEAQRVRLATELAKADDFSHTVYLLDEPTTGLHLLDVERLLNMLIELVRKGNTVLIVEHHRDVMRNADWIVDLGPEGGAAGGNVVACGPPELIAECPDSHTGACLRVS